MSEASSVGRSDLKFRSAGLEAWTSCERIENGMADLVVLRPPGYAEREPPAASIALLNQTIDEVQQLKREAMQAMFLARARLPGDGFEAVLARWKVVEARVDSAGQAWLGLYESSDTHEVWMIQFDATWKPSAVWRRSKREMTHMTERGNRVS